ncbi:sigma-70 family RNA polymerase sigma factor [Gracilibacillus caseinilyticus]|uniref:Sigma-70 family RNA polymerase sigma factor n=1 Tax=Gracilibacillus caseinilyticus TaxID=2932256 RepID=A0ABY4EV12_9BACI|nr:sigma-70 family RNA polymerase sigma factor [Gracilibacillus caseinilyticus]UOQ47657.1 sigma-70 family RNA polymerase sigma factor [Gracilibacillus caseinilyticus]
MIDETKLIDKMKAGNQHAIRMIVERYQHHVFKVTYSVVRDQEIAEDLAQETFIKMLDALPTYQNQGFKTWLSRIALHKAIDHQRQRKRKREELHTFEAFHPVDKKLNVEEEVMAKDQFTIIQQRIKQMPAKFQLVVHAYYFEELSYKQIADRYGLEGTTVKTRLYRARKWMKENWKEEDFR